GSAGITTSMATLVLTFMGQTGKNAMHRGLTLVVGVVIIFLFARSKIIYNLMKKIISKALERWTTMRIFDYEQLLGFNEGYTISRISVRDDSWLSGKKLSELRLEQEGVLILAIYRKIDGKEKFVGGPTGETVIKAQDVLICYSRQDASKALAQKGKQEN
ncbi:MAG: TrkA C-terminal domain-containing protein, partial [Candidatus Omnitrophica bacterium]|nr:TrkA C-terminal domain-containing protein [Candidatus Omnitrophota bacterium]